MLSSVYWKGRGFLAPDADIDQPDLDRNWVAYNKAWEGDAGEAHQLAVQIGMACNNISKIGNGQVGTVVVCEGSSTYKPMQRPQREDD